MREHLVQSLDRVAAQFVWGRQVVVDLLHLNLGLEMAALVSSDPPAVLVGHLAVAYHRMPVAAASAQLLAPAASPTAPAAPASEPAAASVDQAYVEQPSDTSAPAASAPASLGLDQGHP